MYDIEYIKSKLGIEEIYCETKEGIFEFESEPQEMETIREHENPINPLKHLQLDLTKINKTKPSTMTLHIFHYYKIN